MQQTIRTAAPVAVSTRVRPTLFIGSSTAGLKVAQALQQNLNATFEVEIWNQGAFEIGDFNLESLIDTGKRSHFAVLVLTPDDLITVDNIPRPSPRDNVIFEMGLFLGVLGRRQAFIVHEEGSKLKLPTDIDGISRATYIMPVNGSLTAALGAASIKISEAAFSKVEGGYLHKLEMEERRWQEKRKKIQMLVHSALKNVCSALCAPASAEAASLRAFVFKKEHETLVCTHAWSPNPVREVINQLMFAINSETEKQVAVVKAALRKEVCASPISVLPENIEGVEGAIDENLCFVLAAPILGPDGEVWGTVDFDASNKTGENILRKQMSKSVLFDLGKHLYLTLAEWK
ncbi:MAG TPA: nucleotide-binding protein [Chitinophagaceae bacterium]|nr:nucleotide-binding protein [Chitinophagaceae bacterium]